MGKLITHPDKDLARIKAETTVVAGTINREMIALQKKFPDHYFELSFELQRVGKQKFYRIHIKTFNDEPVIEKTPTQMLLEFIKAQGLDVEQFHSLIGPIEKLFTVFERNKARIPATKLLVDRIIRWENGEQETSLEQTINNLFNIEIGGR